MRNLVDSVQLTTTQQYTQKKVDLLPEGTNQLK